MCHGGATGFEIFFVPFYPLIWISQNAPRLPSVAKTKEKISDNQAITEERIKNIQTLGVNHFNSMKEGFDNLQIFLNFTDEEKENTLIKRSLAYVSLKQHKYVERDCVDCLKLNPKNYLAHFLLSLSLGSQGKHLESLEHAKKALEFYKFVIKFESSHEYEKMIQPKEENVFNQMIKDSQSTFETFGNFFTKKEVKKEVIRVLKEEQIYQLIGNCMLQNEFYDEAISHFKESISKLKTNLGYFYYMIGISYYHLHDKKNAEKSFQEALKNGHEAKQCELMIFMTNKSSMEAKLRREKKQKLTSTYKNLSIPDCHLTLLSDDMLDSIFQFCDHRSLIQVEKTNSMFHRFISKPQIWKDRLIEINFDKQNWKDLDQDKNNSRKRMIFMMKHPMFQYSKIFLYFIWTQDYNFSGIKIYEKDILYSLLDKYQYLYPFQLTMLIFQNHRSFDVKFDHHLLFSMPDEHKHIFIVPKEDQKSFSNYLENYKTGECVHFMMDANEFCSYLENVEIIKQIESLEK
jgi:tetratricopeptide (TPR) repeat protein